MKHLSVLVLLAVAPGFVAQARNLVLNVATNGNDHWSGAVAVPAYRGDDGPLATLAHAIEAARAARTAGGVDSVTILLRQGTHTLTEPLVLTPADSGLSNALPFIITAYPEEKPVISGGQRLMGWHPVPDKAGWWQTEVPEVRAGQWYFRSLFVNGHRRQRARTPNTGFFHIAGETPQGDPARFKFKEGDLRPQWATNGDVEVVALLAWSDLRMPIRAVDASNHVVTLAGPPQPSNRENNAQFYIENAPDALDEPGEWYLDRQTGVVTYWALPDESFAQAEVIAPRLPDLLVLQGDPAAGSLVSNIVLRGLTFSFTDWTLGERGYADTQAAINIRGDVRAEGAVDCSVEECLFSHLAGYALELGRGCQRCRIVHNELTDLGAGGLRLGETVARTAALDQCGGHVVTDNDLYQLGRVFPAGVGVLVLQSGHNRIAHNHIHDLFYTAISVGWNWGYQETPCHDNLVEFNHLHDLGQDVLSDMGAIYTLGIQPGTVIRNNLIHDVNAYTYGGWGLYTDEGSSGIRLENNVVYRCKSAGFHQHYGRENIVQNNIFARNREHELMRSREEDHRSFTFTNNIVYFDSGELLGGNWTNDHFIMEGNLYYDARPEARPATLSFAGATLAQWRQRGHDLKSVIADPLFINPRRDNYRLSANSPALALGFKPIDLTATGVRRSGLRD